MLPEIPPRDAVRVEDVPAAEAAHRVVAVQGVEADDASADISPRSQQHVLRGCRDGTHHSKKESGQARWSPVVLFSVSCFTWSYALAGATSSSASTSPSSGSDSSDERIATSGSMSRVPRRVPRASALHPPQSQSVSHSMLLGMIGSGTYAAGRTMRMGRTTNRTTARRNLPADCSGSSTLTGSGSNGESCCWACWPSIAGSCMPGKEDGRVRIREEFWGEGEKGGGGRREGLVLRAAVMAWSRPL